MTVPPFKKNSDRMATQTYHIWNLNNKWALLLYIFSFTVLLMLTNSIQMTPTAKRLHHIKFYINSHRKSVAALRSISKWCCTDVRKIYDHFIFLFFFQGWIKKHVHIIAYFGSDLGVWNTSDKWRCCCLSVPFCNRQLITGKLYFSLVHIYHLLITHLRFLESHIL